jgi:hypothetical protein
MYINKDKFAMIGYGLLGIAAIEHLQNSSSNIHTILYILYILGYLLLSIQESKELKESINSYSYGHLLLFVLYLINLIWFQNTHHHFLEEKNILLISIIFMHFIMITNNKYKKYAIFLATIIYTSIGFKFFTNINNKFNLETLKFIGCFILVIHYLQEFFEKKNKHHKIY